eukprot:TRINITY_DN3020_c0_g2_i1.p1 TRINITY_DN3020_c0_g2~~TRINITY_DN3020_c0_g2_i1.p1  ORF type:complete len:633 (-),score=142.45 TRINITY_DN3020_c0_g2_i1:101-1999(-)
MGEEPFFQRQRFPSPPPSSVDILNSDHFSDFAADIEDMARESPFTPTHHSNMSPDPFNGLGVESDGGFDLLERNSAYSEITGFYGDEEDIMAQLSDGVYTDTIIDFEPTPNRFDFFDTLSSRFQKDDKCHHKPRNRSNLGTIVIEEKPNVIRRTFNGFEQIEAVEEVKIDETSSSSSSEQHFGRSFQNQSFSPKSPKINLFDWSNRSGSSKNRSNAKNMVCVPLERIRNKEEVLLDECLGYVEIICSDQIGSRFIQDNLRFIKGKALFSQLFEEVNGAFYSLVNDPFGNYVIQKFFDIGSQEQRDTFGYRLQNRVLNLSMQMFGCRVVQKAFDFVSLSLKIDLMREIESNVMMCVYNQNGNHVIQKIIEKVPPVKLNFIIEEVGQNISELARHTYGCRVIQRILEHCTDKQKEPIISEILTQAIQLVYHQYGNYVMQHILDKCSTKQRSKLFNIIKDQFVSMAIHEYASHVVEKCLDNCLPDEITFIFEEILNASGPIGPYLLEPTPSVSENDSIIRALLKGTYSNYVIQKLITIANVYNFGEKLYLACSPHLDAIQSLPYGPHIITKLNKNFSNNNVNSNSNINNNNKKNVNGNQMKAHNNSNQNHQHKQQQHYSQSNKNSFNQRSKRQQT